MGNYHASFGPAAALITLGTRLASVISITSVAAPAAAEKLRPDVIPDAS